MNWTILASIVILGVVVIGLFRKNIGGLIDRIKSFGASGVVIDRQQQVAPPPDPSAEAEAVMRLLDEVQAIASVVRRPPSTVHRQP